MTVMADSRSVLDQGRLEQFETMMEQFASIQAKYKGVRGELLAKVRDELMRLRPGANSTPELTEAPKPAPKLAVVPKPKLTPNPVTASALPSCRVCGRGMHHGEVAGQLVCDRGHTRTLT